LCLGERRSASGSGESAEPPCALNCLMGKDEWGGEVYIEGEKRLLTLKEAFSCNDQHTSVIRIALMALGGIMAGVSLYLWHVILTEHSAIHHQCEHEYVVWPMAIVFQCTFIALLVNYFFTKSVFWVNISDGISALVLSTILGWWFFIYFRMSHICLTFYTIKYPVLLAAPNICGPVVLMAIMAIFARRIVAGSSDEVVTTTFYQLFYTANKDFVPRLFQQEKIEAYQTGVKTWGSSVKTRNETLKNAYQDAVDVHRSTVSQSALLSEITEAVGEVGEKARKADEALTNQKNLIDDLSSALDDAEKQLSGMSDKAASMSLGCSRMDYCKWLLISLLCCGTVTLSLLAIPKWLHLIGIRLGINL